MVRGVAVLGRVESLRRFPEQNMAITYNWHCKVCDLVNEPQLNHCAICGAARELTPLHAEILSRTRYGLPQDEAMLKEHALNERMDKMHPLAGLIGAFGVMGVFLGFIIFKVAMTLVAHLWGLGLFVGSCLILYLSNLLDGALNNGGTVQDNRKNILLEKE
jgi:Zn-finger in Ran binding protein and others